MMRRYNRLLVAFYVISRPLLGDGRLRRSPTCCASRPLAGLIPVTKGIPPFERVPATCCRSSRVLVPIAFHVQGLYRLRRGRSRVDDFFAVFVGSILAVVLGVVGTLYFQTYYVPDELKDAGVYEVSQVGWALFLVVNVLLRLRCRASWCARRSSGGGRPASASSAC